MFSSKLSVVKAADDVTFSIKKGEVFVLAGESGSGKTTIAKLILKSIQADSGKIIFEDQEIDNQKKSLEKIRMNCQMIHQDPYDSINPRMRIGDIISEPLEIHNIGNKEERKKRVIEVLQEVKLEPAEEIIQKYPHMLSGGQRQRIAIARAILKNSPILLLDEATSSLDSESEKLIQSALSKLQENRTTIVIAHRLSTIENADKIIVLDQGRIVESGKHNDLIKQDGLYATLHKIQFPISD